MFIEGCDTLLAEPDMPADKKAMVQARKRQIENSPPSDRPCVEVHFQRGR